jgi:hypothetical protein
MQQVRFLHRDSIEIQGQQNIKFIIKVVFKMKHKLFVT